MSDASSVCVTDSRVFVGDTVSRVFISETVSAVFVGDATLEGTLRRLAVLANQAMSGSDMVSVTTLVAGRRRTVGFTDDVASQVDDLQCQSGVGPCLDAVRRQTVIRVDSTENDQRWPAFRRAAAARGILSSLSFPLVVHHQGIGALNCYSRTAAFSADDERTGSAFATAAAIEVAEPPQGIFSRQVFLGEGLDPDHIEARYDGGVLTLTIPVADRVKPRRVEIASSQPNGQPIDTAVKAMA